MCMYVNLYVIFIIYIYMFVPFKQLLCCVICMEGSKSRDPSKIGKNQQSCMQIPVYVGSTPHPVTVANEGL